MTWCSFSIFEWKDRLEKCQTNVKLILVSATARKPPVKLKKWLFLLVPLPEKPIVSFSLSQALTDKQMEMKLPYIGGFVAITFQDIVFYHTTFTDE